MGNRVSIVGEEAEVKRFNMYPANDVREWSMYFKSIYPEGKMKKEDLERIFIKYFLPKEIKTEETKTDEIKIEKTRNFYLKEFINQLFATIDIRERDFITFDDILLAFSALSKGSKIEKLKWIFRFYDINKNGKITKEDFKKGYFNISKIMEFDKNGSKCNEFINQKMEIVENIFKNKEEISFEDFEDIAERNSRSFKKISSFVSF